MDIAALKNSIEELQRTESRLRTLLDAIPDYAIYLLGPKGEVLSWSATAEKMFGYPATEVLGFNESEVLQSATRTADVSDTEQELAAGYTYAEVARRRKDGARFLAREETWPLKDATGELIGAVKMVRDISEVRRLSNLMQTESRLLEKLAKEEPLENILSALCVSIDEVLAGAKCSILLASGDGRTLRHCAAPGVAQKYYNGSVCIEIGPNAAPCGTSAFLKKQVVAGGCREECFEALAPRHGLKTCWCVPVTDSRSEVLGACALYYDHPHAPEEWESQLLSRATHMAAIAIERKRENQRRFEVEKARKGLLRNLMTAQEDERRHIARELHDSTQQSLFTFLLRLKALGNSGDEGALETQVKELRRIVSSALDDLGNIIRGLHPTVLDDVGLLAALSHFAVDYQRMHRVRVTITDQTAGSRLPSEVEMAFYRIAVEALANIAKHAEATEVKVCVQEVCGSYKLSVEDNGQGFNPHGMSEGPGARNRLGLTSIHERAGLLGGRAEIRSKPGAGTCVEVQVPGPSRP